jgi:hypothetical protein
MDFPPDPSPAPHSGYTSGGHGGGPAAAAAPGGGPGIGGVAGNPAMQQLGMDYGARVLGQGHELVTGRISGVMHGLKPYFDVNVSYVGNKLKVVALPLLHRHWDRERAPAHEQRATPYLPPRDDINAPDLYIPLMAFVTYILLVAFLMGTGNQFHPEVLGIVASSGLAVLTLEIVVFKLGLYIVNSPAPLPVTELVAYCGYKYVGVIISMLVGSLLGTRAYYVAAIVNGALCGVFLVKSLRRVLAIDSVSSYDDSSMRKGRYFLLAMAALQVPLMLFLGYSRLIESADALVASVLAAPGAAAGAAAAANAAAGAAGSGLAQAAGEAAAAVGSAAVA